MRSASVTTAAATGASAAIIVDQHLTPQEIGILIDVSAGGSLTTKLQWTLSDPYNADGSGENSSAIWFDDKNLITLTSDTAGIPVNAAGFRQPVRAFRLNNTVWTSGSATLTVVQCGGIS